MNKPKVQYLTFGCKLNFAETATISGMLENEGFETLAQGSSDAPDIVVVNTCSVTELADKKCRQTIRSIAKRHPRAAIMATGCYAQLKPDEVAKLPGIVVVVGNDRKERLVDYARDWMRREATPATDVIASKDMRHFTPSCSRGNRTRYFLKIQDGCDYFCSFCTIPFARGRSRSASIADIVAAARGVAAEEGKEIVITGVNIGDFGKPSGESFFNLIKELDNVDGIERYRISSIEPNLLTDEMIDWVAGSRHFMPHFHIPLQAGSDPVLKLMRRHYGTELFAERVERIKNAMPHAFIGVDVIAGSRGETPRLFDESLSFIDSLDITRLHVFPYSERPGTRALEIKPIVDQAEKHDRVRRLMELSDRKFSRFANSFAGSTRPILVEHTVNHGKMTGFTDNYLKVELDADPKLFNEIVNVDLSGSVATDNDTLKGSISQ